MELGKAMCDHSWLFTSSAQSLVKLPIVDVKLSIVDAEPRARTVINHIGVTNVARQYLCCTLGREGVRTL
jgi:hypothetical protein